MGTSKVTEHTSKWLSTGMTVIGLSTGLALTTVPVKAATDTTGSPADPTTTSVKPSGEQPAAQDSKQSVPVISKRNTTENKMAGTGENAGSAAESKQGPDAKPISEPNTEPKTNPAATTVTTPDQNLTSQTLGGSETGHSDSTTSGAKIEVNSEANGARAMKNVPLHFGRSARLRIQGPAGKGAAVDEPTTTKSEVDGSDLQYTKVETTNSYTVTGYTGTATDVTIPDTYNGAWVTAIHASAFKGKGLTSVVFGKNITTIGASAFQDNNLTNVKLPALQGVLGASAFENNNLASVTFDDGTTLWQIGADAFANNKLKGKLDLPKGLTQILDSAFAGSSDGSGNTLTTVTFGDHLTNIGANAFAYNDLASVDLKNVNSKLEIGDSAFIGNKLTAVTLGTGVQGIDAHAFQNNQLTSVSLPALAGVLGASAFANNELTRVTFDEQATLWQIGTDAFADNFLAGKLDLPKGLTQILADAFAGKSDGSGNKLNAVTFGDHLTNIGSNAFAYNDLNAISLVNVDYQANNPQKTGLEIGDSAFIGNKVQEAKLGYGVKEIDASAFQNNQLTSVSLPALDGALGDSAFANNQLTSVTFDKQATLWRIGTDAFANNELKGELDLPKGLTQILAGAFAGNSENKPDEPGNKLTTVTFGDHLTNIGSNAFANNDLKAVSLANTDYQVGNPKNPGLEVGASAFASNPNLSSLKLNSGVAGIDSSAFGGDQIGGALVIPNSLKNIGASAFVRNQVTGLTFADGGLNSELKTIGASAFESNQFTDTLALPQSVTNIGASAFANNRLSGLILGNEFQEDGTQIGDLAFSDNGLTRVTMGGNVKNLGDNAFLNQSKQLKPVSVTVSLSSDGKHLEGVRVAMMHELGVTLKSPMVFTYTDKLGNETPLSYDFDKDELTLPDNFVGLSLTPISFSSGQIKTSADHSGNYSTDDLILKWTPNSTGSGTTTQLPATTGASTATSQSQASEAAPTTVAPHKGSRVKSASKRTQPKATTAIRPTQQQSVTPAVTRSMSHSNVTVTFNPATGTNLLRTAAQRTSHGQSVRQPAWRYVDNRSERLASHSSAITTDEPATTLPQTNEQRSGWQRLGISLLAALGWLGLGFRKHQS